MPAKKLMAQIRNHGGCDSYDLDGRLLFRASSHQHLIVRAVQMAKVIRTHDLMPHRPLPDVEVTLADECYEELEERLVVMQEEGGGE